MCVCARALARACAVSPSVWQSSAEEPDTPTSSDITDKIHTEFRLGRVPHSEYWLRLNTNTFSVQTSDKERKWEWDFVETYLKGCWLSLTGVS